jgi:stress response protein SCP2
MEDYSNKIYFNRSRKVVLPEKSLTRGTADNQAEIVTLLRNLEAYGYVLSPNAVKTLAWLNRDQIVEFSKELTDIVRKAKGAHVVYEPMYPNFPEQVANASDVELYGNAFLHYFGDWLGVRIMPVYAKDEREPLVDFKALEVIDAGSAEDFMLIFTNLLSSKVALSESDNTDLHWFFKNYGTALDTYVPAVIPNKENLATAASFAYEVDSDMFAAILGRASTATDLLRVAATLSGSTDSLSGRVRFTNFSKATRRAFLSSLNNMSSIVEDMIRHKELWKMLGEKLHPGQYAARFPNAHKAFATLRNNGKVFTFGGLVETAIQNRSIDEAVALLSTRPGEFARRLDKLIRTTGNAENICDAFDEVAVDVATPVLWQVKNHFSHRRFDGAPVSAASAAESVAPVATPRPTDAHSLAKELKDFFENRSFSTPETKTKRKAPGAIEANANKKLRTFFPKSNAANIHAIEDTLPSFDEAYAHEIVESCNRALKAIYAGKESLGKVFIDPDLKRFTIPSAVRSASRSLNTVGRGTRTPLGTGDTVRLFIWWKDGKNRTDLDLSVLMLDENHKSMGTVSYYNLREFGAIHSGDITSAPNGASEFIDISVSHLRERGVKYVMMAVNSFTDQPFFELPECFAGFMSRKDAQSGEIYDPRTVENVFDLTADTKVSVPLILDLESNESIWTDLALTRNPDTLNNVHFNKSALTLLNQSMVELNRPSLYDLFAIHAAARGQQVSDKADADTSFEVVNGRVSVDAEKIFADFL